MATNNLTTEALMIPRYKVIADYPGTAFEVGEIVRGDKKNVCVNVLSEVDSYIPVKLLDDYPAIFRRMNWAEERKAGEIPDYVADKTTGIIYEVTDYAISGEFAEFKCKGYNAEQWMPEWLSIEYAIPSTEEAFKNQQK